MMKLQVALFNWLQIYLVSERRPNDEAAKETVQFFDTILQETYQLSAFKVCLDREDDQYVVTYWHDEAQHTAVFHREDADRLWQDIEASPKYND